MHIPQDGMTLSHFRLRCLQEAQAWRARLAGAGAGDTTDCEALEESSMAN